MKRRAWDSRIIALLIGSYLAPQVSTAHEPSVEYHVFTSTELVQAIDAANSGTAPAVIFLFPREYVLSDTFDSEFGVSTLPPIKSNITLVGRNTATTILRGGRMFTVLAGGRLTVRNVTLTGGRGADTDEPFPNGGGAAANFHEERERGRVHPALEVRIEDDAGGIAVAELDRHVELGRSRHANSSR